ncbi:putative BTB/POZ domain-containing protein KCTD8/12/16 [Monocercomonoides exilis]|uniref:putative BTB/POZ domain-containing protein KCTD8/12/16 n=1 Tax=Monocercomonoides exilis TaxID=2049356 RepID=UPI00355A7469|nr:putative BTB/POZ domain-containing protein KCTD8/12/16 [Monocercomonoides exilis]|eukprot:MONOS_6972.1-p1 / transcript=MONOS_6972.1 / gene=MONOS_6972 / organism=Monocercomonoides_exilis_PA203 / gene_product=unspecified product / transcript_product=unspecified product / location=Mono_scaffold00229:49532-51060(+) / protein_length=333 / sequence_SO=supercontig / SO=protein_coding / is_pseudo=false
MSLTTIMDQRLLLDKEREEFARYSVEAMRNLDMQRKQLQRDKEAFEEQKRRFENRKAEHAKISVIKKLDEEVVELNVGGKLFTTLKTTLMKQETSLLAQMISGKKQVVRDKDGRIFLDRNPEMFSMILEFLRTDSLPVAFISPAEEKTFHSELDFFSLGPSTVPFVAVWNPHLKSKGLELRDDGKTVEVVGEDGDHTIIIGDRKITSGVVSITVQVVIPRPNRYSFGVLPDIPPHFNRGFGYKNGVLGWGLHDHTGSLGIFCQTQLVAPSTLGYSTGDLVTLTVDVDRGNLFFKVNGIRCAELLNCEVIKLGVYIGATLFNKGAVWKIVQSKI